MMRFRLLAFVFSIFLLASCSSTGGQFNEAASFDSKGDRALIIIGLTNPKRPERSRKPQLNFRKFNPSTKTANSDLVSVYVPTGPSALGVDFEKEDSKTFYIFDAEEGHYFLESMYYSYYELETRSSNSVTTVLRDNTPSFLAKAGEVVYLGEFDYINKVTAGIELSHNGFDEEKVEAILKQYEGIDADPIEAQIDWVKFNCARGVISGAYICDHTTLNMQKAFSK